MVTTDALPRDLEIIVHHSTEVCLLQLTIAVLRLEKPQRSLGKLSPHLLRAVVDFAHSPVEIAVLSWTPPLGDHPSSICYWRV
mmetsp:Transcript_18014/g.41679  ORF Transcript_18014/g.41679 Transcript_18014/m.41679 type:complete len:83 (+) Transcript_18014:2261-2509(+)